MIYRQTLLLLLLFCSQPIITAAQTQDSSWLAPAGQFRPGRFWPLLGTGVVAYTGVTIALDKVWYAGFSRGRFRFFNDWHEWEQMDKIGHATTAYYESAISYKAARWTGLSKRGSLWSSVIASSVFQLTIEVMDGFSEKWGFSPADIGFNALGTALFAGQEAWLDRQPFQLKVSARLIRHPADKFADRSGGVFTSLHDRAAELYGTSVAERLLKDYNGQTYWLSFNPSLWNATHSGWWPGWLSVSLGYGAGNMYGGFGNSWTTDGAQFSADPALYPRHRRFFLSLDIDWTRLPVRSRYLKTLLYGLQFIKIPFPAIEVNSLGQFRGHAVYF